MKAALKDFDNVFVDCSSGSRRLKKDEIFDSGDIPVIDQGQKPIAGYTDDADAVCNVDLPVVIFGDHTRAFKYVDFPFAVGADGVKVLRPKNGDDEKFLYYQCLSMDVEDNGYSRHYKFLKKKSFFLPEDKEEQKRIAAILDQADSLRRARRQSIEKLNSLSQAIFYEMFGDPVKNERGWNVKALKTLTTKISSGSTPKGGKENYVENGIIFFRSQNVWRNRIEFDDVAYIDEATHQKMKKTSLQHGDILITKTGRINNV